QLGVAEFLAQFVADLEPLECIDHPLRRAPPEAVGAPHDVIDAVVFDVLADQVLAHDRVLDGQAAESRADLGVNIVHLRITLLDFISTSCQAKSPVVGSKNPCLLNSGSPGPCLRAEW